MDTDLYKAKLKKSIEETFDWISNCNEHCPVKSTCDLVEQQIGGCLCRHFKINDGLNIKVV